MTLPVAAKADCQLAVPGIIGGLGPLAHLQFEQILCEQSRRRGARCDQDYPVWILMNATQVPDRTQSIKGHASDCTPWLVCYGRMLQKAGADFLVVTCNTAHAFYEAVAPHIDLPWIPLMGCTAQRVLEQYPSACKIGILATDGTLQSRLYHRSFIQAGLTPIYPALSSPMQQRVMRAIYHPKWGIKATGILISNQALQDLAIAAAWLSEQGAEVVIAGCTELSVGLARIPALSVPWIDPLEAIAAITLDLAYGLRSPHSLLVA